MGRLQKITLENFKSYEGVQEIGPFDNFTCIIGPNGSGKSNMMDAISFVLGVQSRHLRSTNLKDLIFRKDANSAPARKASVTLVYEIGQGERVRGYENVSEIHFSRNINSGGASTYRVNNQSISYEDYESLLADIGVLVKVKNFLVFQGDVESVASKSPQELTKFLEQICGSDQYVAEYERLLRERTEAEENAAFSFQKKRMILQQQKEIKSQKEEAEYFERRKEELGDAKTEHALWQIWRIKNDVETHQQAARRHKEDAEGLVEVEEGIEKDIELSKKDLAKLSREIGTEEGELGKKAKLLEGVAPKTNEARAKLKSLQKRAAEHRRREERETAEVAEQAQAVADLRAEIADLTKLEAKHSAELSSSSSEAGVKLSSGDWAEYTRLRGEVSASAAENAAREVSLNLELKTLQANKVIAEGSLRSEQDEYQAGEKLLKSFQDHSAQLQAAIQRNESEQRDLRAEKARREEESRTSATQLRFLKAEVAQLNEKLRSAGNDNKRSSQADRIAEAIKTLQTMYPGVRGRLLDHCRPIQKRYGQAVTVAAGRHMDAIIVDNTATAAHCMAYLKEQKVGVCQFLPLETIVANEVPAKLRTFGEQFRPCIDVMEFEDEFRPAVLYAVGATVVCNTLEDAQDLCFRRREQVKVVTLEGQVISKSGAMTGGTVAGDGQKDRWADKDLENLRRAHATATARISALEHSADSRQQLVEMEHKLTALENSIKFSGSDIKITDSKARALEATLKDRRTKIAAVEKELASINTKIAAKEGVLEGLRSSTREIENAVFAAFSARVGVANIREFEEQTQRKHSKAVQQQAAVSKKLATLSSQLEFQESRNCERALEGTRRDIAATREEIARTEELEQSTLDKEVKIRAAMKAVSEKIEDLKQQAKSFNMNLDSARNRQKELQAQKERLLKQAAGEDNLVERARVQLHEVLQKAQVDLVALPAVESAAGEDADLTWTGTHSSSQLFTSRRGDRRSDGGSGGDSDSSASQQSKRLAPLVDKSTSKSDKQRVALVDLSSIQFQKNADKVKATVAKEAELSRRIADIASELDSLQPNMHAKERYEAIEQKLREVSEEHEGMKELSTATTSRFDEVKRDRLAKFSDCYEHVSRSLAVIYSDLTRSKKHPLGGNAYLTLDNTEEPYVGGIRFTAMPPMKRFREIEALSGGEKTMAALALLFSIHSYRRAPFFVLDEVDAALDNVNVQKICNYIRQCSLDFQCVVITLKDMFFEHADSLVGVCKDVNKLSSEVLTLDLRAYGEGSGANSSQDDGTTSPMSSVASSRDHTPSSQQRRGSAPLGKRRSPGDSLPSVTRMHPQRIVEADDEDQSD